PSKRPPVERVNVFLRDFFGEAGVWGIRLRHLTAAVVCAGVATLAGPSSAQPRQPASEQDPVYISIPENTSQETGIDFFYFTSANDVDRAFRQARAAIAKCDRKAYDKATAQLAASIEWARKNAGFRTTTLIMRQYKHDEQLIEKARDNLPKFPESCNQPARPGETA